jgi:peroxiredoxin
MPRFALWPVARQRDARPPDVDLYAGRMAVSSFMVPIGTPAPDFALFDLSGATVRRDDFADAPALLVAFLCNHCPYVKHVERTLGTLVAGYPDLAAVGISTNDAESYPDDAPEHMAAQVERAGWTFPYLIDETQEVGRAHTRPPVPRISSSMTPTGGWPTGVRSMTPRQATASPSRATCCAAR